MTGSPRVGRNDRDHVLVDRERTPPSAAEDAAQATPGPAKPGGTAARRPDGAMAVRLEAADRRDEAADVRDLAARVRDAASQTRDLKVAQRGARYAHESRSRPVPGTEVVPRAAELRRRAAADRAEAAEQRAAAADDRRAAADDRRAAADDREAAARDRLSAHADRETLALQLAAAETDALTGSRSRGAGLAELERERDRCRRTDAPLAVAYVDIVGLKAVNDEFGHGAGDTLLRRVVRTIAGELRSYDHVVRLGGDEFLCAMPDMTLADARRRFEAIGATLARPPDPATIRTGFAELAPDDCARDLIERADHELIGQRGR